MVLRLMTSRPELTPSRIRAERVPSRSSRSASRILEAGAVFVRLEATAFRFTDASDLSATTDLAEARRVLLLSTVFRGEGRSVVADWFVAGVGCGVLALSVRGSGAPVGGVFRSGWEAWSGGAGDGAEGCGAVFAVTPTSAGGSIHGRPVWAQATVAPVSTVRSEAAPIKCFNAPVMTSSALIPWKNAQGLGSGSIAVAGTTFSGGGLAICNLRDNAVHSKLRGRWKDPEGSERHGLSGTAEAHAGS